MKIAILGAGLCGITAALELHKSEKIKDIVVFERLKEPGGLMNSISEGDYIWDYGAYKFKQSNFLVRNYPYLFKKVLVERKVWLNNEMHKFPIDLMKLLKNRNHLFYLQLLIQFSQGLFKRIFEKDNINAKEWLKNRMTGKLLTESKIDSYIFKVQGGISLNELSPKLEKEKLKFLFGTQNSILKIIFYIKKILKISLNKNNPYFEYYPINTGVKGIIDHLILKCVQRGINICCKVTIKQINLSSNERIAIVYHKNNIEDTIIVDHIISTIDLSALMNLINPNFLKQN